MGVYRVPNPVLVDEMNKCHHSVTKDVSGILWLQKRRQYRMQRYDCEFEVMFLKFCFSWKQVIGILGWCARESEVYPNFKAEVKKNIILDNDVCTLGDEFCEGSELFVEYVRNVGDDDDDGGLALAVTLCDAY